MRERPFQLFYAQFLGTLTAIGAPMMYYFVPPQGFASSIGMPPSVPSDILFTLELSHAIIGIFGSGSIGAWIGYLTADIATRIAKHKPEWASTLMFVSLLLPFVFVVPAIWALTGETARVMAIATLILSLLLSAAVIFGFRLNGWPGPMSEKPGREVWREYWETRRKLRT